MPRNLWALGVGASGPGYPHGATTISLLAGHADWNVRDVVRWLPADVHLWRLGRGGLSERLRVLTHIAYRALFLPIDLIRARFASALVFVPYPSFFALAAARCLPRALRPRIVADCFISLWDSGFSDRSIAAKSGSLARAVKAIEAWSLRAADIVLVDTIENARFFEREFEIDPACVQVTPLALDVEKLRVLEPASSSPARPLRVLYVGTFVPLHGFQVIVDALRLLSAKDDIEFRIVGDGQDAPLLEAAMREGFSCRVEWIRAWQSADDLVAHYAWAEVCLGVFGAAGKASRVLPFKLYLALAASRAVVTQESMGLPVAEHPPAKRCESTGPSLAEALRELANHRAEVGVLARDARRYFDDWLSAEAIKVVWSRVWEKTVPPRR